MRCLYSFLLCSTAWATYEQLPNEQLPPDTSPTLSSSISWKGQTFQALLSSSTQSTAATSPYTGALTITPAATQSSVSGVFPVPGDSSNPMLRGFAQIDLSSSVPYWVRVQVTSPAPVAVTDNGSSTGYYSNDFLIYSKESSGDPTTTSGWYIGPSYSYNSPAEFATLGIGSLITPSEASSPVPGGSRADSTQSVLTGTVRTSSSGLSTFYWTPQLTNLAVGQGATNTTLGFSGLGTTALLLAQSATYVDPGVGTLATSSPFLVGSLFLGAGGFNRDPNAAIYTANPNRTLAMNTSLVADSYYQYTNSGNSPALIVASSILSIPSSTLLESSGDVTLSNSASISGGTLLFSGTSNILTLDGTSTCTPDLLAVETSLLTLAVSSGSPTVNPSGFDLLSGSTLTINSGATLLTPPGTTWHGYGSGQIPAVPYAATLTGEGTLHLTTPTPAAGAAYTWQNSGSILVDTLILDASIANTTLINQGLIDVTTLIIPDESSTYFLTSSGQMQAETLTIAAPLALTQGTLFVTNATLTNSFTNYGSQFSVSDTLTMDNSGGGTVSLSGEGLTINTLTLNPNSNAAPYQINPGTSTTQITQINQGSADDVTNVTFSEYGGGALISAWNITSPATSDTTTLSSGANLDVTNLTLTNTALAITGNGENIGQFSVNGLLTLTGGSSITWDPNNVMTLQGSIVADSASSIVGSNLSGDNSILQIPANLSMSGSLLLRAPTLFFSSYSSLSTSPGSNVVLQATNTIEIPSTSSLTLDQNTSLTSASTIVIEGSLFGPGGASGLAAINGTTVSSGGSLYTGQTPSDTLLVSGNTGPALTFSEGGSFLPPVEAHSDQSSLVSVTGDVVLGGALIIQPTSADLRARTQWTVLSSSGTITGAFSTIGSLLTLNGYTLSWAIVDDPSVVITVNATQPFNEGVHCHNPLRAANALQTIYNQNCDSTAFDNFLIDTLIPYIYDASNNPTLPFSKLGGLEYSALAAGWLETALQSFVPLQQWIWTSPCAAKEPNGALISAMAGGIENHSAACGQGQWSGSNLISTLGAGRWIYEHNALAVGIQNEWLWTHLTNGSKGHSSLYTIEGIFNGSFCSPHTTFDVYGALTAGAGGGEGEVRRKVSIDSFAETLKSSFSLITFKGQFETGLKWKRPTFSSQAFLSLSGAGSSRSKIKEHGGVTRLSSASNTFGLLRCGLGGSLTGHYTLSPQIAATGYWQEQYGGEALQMHFTETSCRSFTQTGSRLSPFGLLLQGILNWHTSSERLAINLLLNTDLSSHLFTYGGEAALTLRW